jgi:hypothetical protein
MPVLRRLRGLAGFYPEMAAVAKNRACRILTVILRCSPFFTASLEG